MKVDGSIPATIRDVPAAARQLETAGYSGGWTSEAAHDPFLPLALAAEHTEELDLGTSVAVAFARNPMTLANIGWDLQALSGGRFMLGLGSQIEAHIRNRFSMPWSSPAPRMREMILAIRAIWEAWLTDTPLAFRGEFFTHTLMTPMFAPDPADLEGCGVPRILVGGVGEHMTEVSGEVADGFIAHGFTTERYLREVTIPALARGRAKAGKSMDDFEIVGLASIVTGTKDGELEPGVAKLRRQLAFCGSTPAYRRVLDVHGWGGLHEELHAMSKRGLWQEMGNRIDDDMLSAFAIVGHPDQVAQELHRRFGHLVQRVGFYDPRVADQRQWQHALTATGAIGARRTRSSR